MCFAVVVAVVAAVVDDVQNVVVAAGPVWRGLGASCCCGMFRFSSTTSNDNNARIDTLFQQWGAPSESSAQGAVPSGCSNRAPRPACVSAGQIATAWILGGARMNAMWLMFAALVIGSLPAVVRGLYPPLFFRRSTEVNAQVVVVLGAGHRLRHGRYLSAVAGLRRMQFALVLAAERKLPLLICGGRHRVPDSADSEAALLADEVRQRAPLQPVWLEEDSTNTWENAKFAAQLLCQRGVTRVALVTDRPHMSRALMCFRQHGLIVEPVALDRLPRTNWVPTAAALVLIPEIWYEWLALCWYALRWRAGSR